MGKYKTISQVMGAISALGTSKHSSCNTLCTSAPKSTRKDHRTTPPGAAIATAAGDEKI